MMALLVCLILLISVHELVNGQDLLTIEHNISRSDDDVERLYDVEGGCTSKGSFLDIAYSAFNQRAQDVLLTFRNISHEDISNAEEAHIEFESMSNANLPLSAVIRYNTIAAYGETNCNVSYRDNWSNSTVAWELPVTVISQIFTTTNIINLVQENLESPLWRDTGRLELIISQQEGPNANNGNAVRKGRSYDSWASDSAGNYPPKLVLKLPVQPSASPSSSRNYDQTTTAINSAVHTPSSSSTNPSPTPPAGTASSTLNLAPSTTITGSSPQTSAPVPSPMTSCSTNIHMKGYLIVNHTSAIETVTSTMACCKKCSEIRGSCKSLSIGKLPTSGSSPSFICQINNITKEESDRSHCFKKDDTFTHYNVFP